MADAPKSTKRPPTPGEAKMIRGARGRGAARAPRVEVARTSAGSLGSPHSDNDGNFAALMDAFGTSSDAFRVIQTALLQYSATEPNSSLSGDPVVLNASLALVQAIQPENELEAALAVQMANVHLLAGELLGRVKQSDQIGHKAMYGGLAVKLMRTFTAQVEALAKLRAGGKQTVEVVHVHKHVYVMPGGQAVVGDFHQGGGGAIGSGPQPHALPDFAHLIGPEMLGADAEGSAVPIPAGEGTEALPDARRKESGRASRSRKRALSARTSNEGSNGRAPRRQGDPCAREGGAR